MSGSKFRQSSAVGDRCTGVWGAMIMEGRRMSRLNVGDQSSGQEGSRGRRNSFGQGGVWSETKATVLWPGEPAHHGDWGNAGCHWTRGGPGMSRRPLHWLLNQDAREGWRSARLRLGWKALGSTFSEDLFDGGKARKRLSWRQKREDCHKAGSTNQGNNFQLQLLAELYWLPWGQVHTIHRYVDGLVKCCNKTLKDMLKKAASEIGID